MDSTTHTMILVTKLWGLSWSYRDGFLPKSELRNEGQEERKISHLPTLLEYMGFVHFSSGCIIGPFIEYIDFKNWIYLEGHYKDMPRGDFTTVWPSIKRFFAGCGCVLLHLTLTVYFGYSVYFCGKPEF